MNTEQTQNTQGSYILLFVTIPGIDNLAPLMPENLGCLIEESIKRELINEGVFLEPPQLPGRKEAVKAALSLFSDAYKGAHNAFNLAAKAGHLDAVQTVTINSRLNFQSDVFTRVHTDPGFSATLHESSILFRFFVSDAERGLVVVKEEVRRIGLASWHVAATTEVLALCKNAQILGCVEKLKAIALIP